MGINQVYYVHVMLAYLRGRRSQLSPHYCSYWAGPNRLRFLLVWAGAGFGGWQTGAETSAGTWGRRSPPLLVAADIKRGAANCRLCRARCLRLIEWIGPERRDGAQQDK